jgi:hypothetical protein
MGLFGKKKEIKITPLANPRYERSPVNILFENFVLSTIDKLPQDKVDKLNSMNLAKVFNTEPKDWKLIVKQALQLSDTIEIAILDLWYKNQELASQQGIEYHPNQFALDFTDRFLNADSRIDSWDVNTLNQAKERIKRNQARGF